MESEKLYQRIPDIRVAILDKKEILISDLWKERPLFLNFFYARCSTVCNPFLRSLKRAVDETGGLGRDYAILSLSFDPSDTVEDARRAAEAIGVAGNSGWLFGVAGRTDLSQIFTSTGFRYRSDPGSLQFDHPSLLIGIRDGRIMRVLARNTVTGSGLRDVLFDLKGVSAPFIAVPGINTRFRCFQIDDTTQEVRFDWGLLILLIPGIAALAVTFAIFRSSRRKS